MRVAALRLPDLRLAALRMPALRVPRLVRQHVLSSAVLVVMAMLYLLAGISVTSIGGRDGVANAKTGRIVAAQLLAKAPPGPEPLQFKAVSPEDAVAWNASIPVSTLANPAARPFMLRAASEMDRQRALACLTAAVYYEAATESADGQRAVAQVVLNRVRHPAYPASVCGVVFQGSERTTGCQFTFTCDGSIARAPAMSYWARARSVAEAALAGYVYAPAGWATHYHTNWVVPYWSASLAKAANIGTHIFYRWEGGWGRGPAFTNRMSGNEPVLARMHHIGFGSAPVQETLTPEQRALLAAGEVLPGTTLPDGTLAAAAPPLPAYDPAALNRAILRRFVPAKAADVASVIAKQTKPGETVEESHRWALTGGIPSDSLGKAPPAEAKPGS